jgi:hypothetical protein
MSSPGITSDKYEEFKDYAFYFSIIKRWPQHLARIPLHFRDREICMEAIKQDKSALKYVPSHLQAKMIN